jgi:hypothetical protein
LARAVLQSCPKLLPSRIARTMQHILVELREKSLTLNEPYSAGFRRSNKALRQLF